MKDLLVCRAGPEHVDAVWAMVRRAVADMNRRGNPQWGPDYPAWTHYAEAQERGELYMAVEGTGRTVGCAVFNTEEEPAYAAVPWTIPGPAMVIHKLAVEPEAQRQGVASALVARCNQLALAAGLPALRGDTYTENRRMQVFFFRQGFRRAGEVHFPINPLPYPCFERAVIP